jgi:hypothetical protein
MKLALLAITLAGGVIATSAASSPLRTATFEARHEVKVTVPEGVRALRIWVAMPQEDPAQRLRDFKVEAPAAHRITTDSEGNKAVYVEVLNPKEKEFTVVETVRQVARKRARGWGN